LPDGGILCLDNGFHGDGIHHPYSRVLELDASTRTMAWDYRDKDNDNVGFYSGFMSSCQRLPNGNTLIAESRTGRVFEVTRNGEIVWEFVNPEYTRFRDYGTCNVVTAAFRYGPDYPGLKRLSGGLRLGKIIQTERDVLRNTQLKEARDQAAEDAVSKEAKKRAAVQSRLARLGY
jgi:hypothetical protein